MLRDLNALEGPVKFTYELHAEQIHFLDIELCRQDVHIEYTLFRKKMDKNVLLHYNSCHPSFVYSTKFSSGSNVANKEIRNHWSIIQADDGLNRVIPEKPMTCYQRGTNLRDLLVKSDSVRCYQTRQDTWLQIIHQVV